MINASRGGLRSPEAPEILHRPARVEKGVVFRSVGWSGPSHYLTEIVDSKANARGVARQGAEVVQRAAGIEKRMVGCVVAENGGARNLPGIVNVEGRAAKILAIDAAECAEINRSVLRSRLRQTNQREPENSRTECGNVVLVPKGFLLNTAKRCVAFPSPRLCLCRSTNVPGRNADDVRTAFMATYKLRPTHFRSYCSRRLERR